MSRLIRSCLLLVLAITLPLNGMTSVYAVSGSDWNAGRITDDQVFFAKSEFTPSQIQEFLSERVPLCDTNGSKVYNGSTTRAAYGTSKGYPPPYTCLKDYSTTIREVAADTRCKAIPAGTYSSASLLYLVSNACEVSVRALIVLLEKEQGLVSDDWPWSYQYRSATGYGCPDTAECDSRYYGLFNQIYMAAWQFRSYLMYPDSYRYKPYQNNAILYNPNSSCGSSTVYIQNRATAALYNYTPYQPNTAALNNLYGTGDGCSAYGNRNFWRIFNDWFGSTYSVNYMCLPSNNIALAADGRQIQGTRYGSQDRTAFTLTNRTGSGCAEAHILNSDYRSWAINIATTQPSFDPSSGKLLTLRGSEADSRLVLIKYKGTQNDMIEFHVWDDKFQKWTLHEVTDQPASELAHGKLVSVDNRIVFVKYKNTYRDMIEMHGWNKDLTDWEYHTVSNQPANELNYGYVMSANDKLVYIKHAMGKTANNMTEIHEWTPDFKKWASHSISDLPAADMENGSVVSRGKKLVYVKDTNTSYGKVEFHELRSDYKGWTQHAVSPIPASSKIEFNRITLLVGTETETDPEIGG